MRCRFLDPASSAISEHDRVLLIFSVLGTGSLSIVNYLNEKKVPFRFPAAAHKKFHQPNKYPWVMGWVPSFRFEGRISSLQDHATPFLSTFRRRLSCVGS